MHVTENSVDFVSAKIMMMALIRMGYVLSVEESVFVPDAVGMT